jgi:serine/threonine protein phosphatase PrpC
MDICVDNANRAIFNAANSNPQYAGMGTTLVVAVFRDNRLLLGHVGDSRCYRCAPAAAADHARPFAAAGADRRRPDHPRAGAFSANKNLVTRAVGVEDTVLLETHQHDVQPATCT